MSKPSQLSVEGRCAFGWHGSYQTNPCPHPAFEQVELPISHRLAWVCAYHAAILAGKSRGMAMQALEEDKFWRAEITEERAR